MVWKETILPFAVLMSDLAQCVLPTDNNPPSASFRIAFPILSSGPGGEKGLCISQKKLQFCNLLYK
jgi:hypothetical protein